jgi:acid phosphatase class B
VETDWRGAVEAMSRALEALPGKVEAAADEDSEEMKTEVKDAAGALAGKLAEVNKLFRPDAFTVVIKRMTANGASDADISAAKEDGLREVRRLRKFMEAQRTLRLVAAIPDSFKAEVPMARLSSALFDMETNLTISG